MEPSEGNLDLCPNPQLEKGVRITFIPCTIPLLCSRSEGGSPQTIGCTRLHALYCLSAHISYSVCSACQMFLQKSNES